MVKNSFIVVLFQCERARSVNFCINTYNHFWLASTSFNFILLKYISIYVVRVFNSGYDICYIRCNLKCSLCSTKTY